MDSDQSGSPWGEFPDIYDAKIETDDVYTIFPPEKRARLQFTEPANDDPPKKT